MNQAQLLQIFEDFLAFQWAMDISLLMILIFLFTRNKKEYSNIISLVVFTLVGGIGYRYSLVILQSNPDVALTSLQLWLQDHDKAMHFIWYIGLCIFDSIGLLAIYLLHQKLKLPNGIVTKTILLAYLIDSSLNVVRFTERSLFETHYLKSIYQWGIISINIGVLMVVLSVAVKAAYEHIQRQKPIQTRL